MRILTEAGYIDAVALFFELSDEQLEKVAKDKDYYQSRERLEEFNNAKGNNAHFFGIAVSNKQVDIRSYIPDLLKQYDTVSWWDKDMNEFHLIRR